MKLSDQINFLNAIASGDPKVQPQCSEIIRTLEQVNCTLYNSQSKGVLVEMSVQDFRNFQDFKTYQEFVAKKITNEL